MDSITNHPLALAVIIALPLFGIIAKLFGASFRRIAKWYLYIAVFAVVVVMDSIFFPFIGGKDYFFRFAVELALIFFIFAWAFEARAGEIEGEIKALFKKPLFLAVTAFAVMFLLACIFAYDMSAAFWSNYERGEGGFQMIHYYLFFALLALLLRTESDWKDIFRFSLVAAGAMIVYGIFGSLGASSFIGPFSGGGAVPDGWVNKILDGRFEGSLGNPAYVAPYLMFSMFYAAYLWVRRKRSASAKANKLFILGYVLLILVFVFFFVLSQTRGAFLGLGAGVVVMLLYVFFSSGAKLRKWSLVALAILVVLGGTGYVFRNSSFVQRWPGARLLQLSVSDASAQTRFWTWGSAWKGFLERPVLGWGPENFTTVFDKYFDPRHYVPGQQTETWFDRAHSVFFDYLSETGALGLLAYLSIFVTFAWEFIRKRKALSAEEPHTWTDSLVGGLVIAMPIAYLIQGVAIFDVLPMYLNLFLFLGFAYYYFYVHNQAANANQPAANQRHG
jgi:O-antigen ligase